MKSSGYNINININIDLSVKWSCDWQIAFFIINEHSARSIWIISFGCLENTSYHECELFTFLSQLARRTSFGAALKSAAKNRASVSHRNQTPTVPIQESFPHWNDIAVLKKEQRVPNLHFAHTKPTIRALLKRKYQGKINVLRAWICFPVQTYRRTNVVCSHPESQSHRPSVQFKLIILHRKARHSVLFGCSSVRNA